MDLLHFTTKRAVGRKMRRCKISVVNNALVLFMKPLGRQVLPNCVDKCGGRILRPFIKSAAGVGRDDGCVVFPGQKASRDQVAFGALLGNKQCCRGCRNSTFY